MYQYDNEHYSKAQAPTMHAVYVALDGMDLYLYMMKYKNDLDKRVAFCVIHVCMPILRHMYLTVPEASLSHRTQPMMVERRTGIRVHIYGVKLSIT